MGFNASTLPVDLKTLWNDDSRMQLYFASFPASRAVNPASWDAKMEFWTRLIEHSCGDNLTFSIKDLHLVFSRNGMTPICMDTVVDHLKNTKQIINKDTYMSWTAWTMSLITSTSSEFILMCNLKV